MTITTSQFQHLCKLSALKLDEAQQARILPQLDAIVGFVSQLESLDLSAYTLTDDQLGHTNSGLIQSEFDLLSNIHHPIKGNMPAFSFSTKATVIDEN